MKTMTKRAGKTVLKLKKHGLPVTSESALASSIAIGAASSSPASLPSSYIDSTIIRFFRITPFPRAANLALALSHLTRWAAMCLPIASAWGERDMKQIVITFSNYTFDGRLAWFYNTILDVNDLLSQPVVFVIGSNNTFRNFKYHYSKTRFWKKHWGRTILMEFILKNS